MDGLLLIITNLLNLAVEMMHLRFPVYSISVNPMISSLLIPVLIN